MTSKMLTRSGAARASRSRRWGADWLPAALGALLIWVATGAVAGQGFLGTLQQSIIVASFLALGDPSQRERMIRSRPDAPRIDPA